MFLTSVMTLRTYFLCNNFKNFFFFLQKEYNVNYFHLSSSLFLKCFSHTLHSIVGYINTYFQARINMFGAHRLCKLSTSMAVSNNHFRRGGWGVHIKTKL